MNLICPQCKTVNQPNAKFCSGCGIGFAVVPIKTKKNSITPLFWLLGLLGLALLIGGVGSVSDKTNSGAGFSQSDTSTSGQPGYKSPPLRLLSSRGETEYDYVTVQGEVQNNTTEKLDSVWVLVSHYDKSGQLVTTDKSIIDYQPLMPGQTSPFKAMTRHNPLMATYKIAFQQGFGGELDYIDARPTKNPPAKKGKQK